MACAAMLAGISYSEAETRYQALYGTTKNRNQNLRFKALRRFLSRLGVHTKIEYFRSWSQLGSHSIVGIYRGRESGLFHWVVFDAARELPTILDPSARRIEPITDLRRKRPGGNVLIVT